LRINNARVRSSLFNPRSVIHNLQLERG